VGFISSGGYFRAATYRALELGIPLSEGDRVSELVSRLDVAFSNEPSGLRVLIAGTDRTDALKAPAVTSQVKFVAENLAVRGVLAQVMQAHAARGPVLAEGRDMGSVVFPEAPIKFFLHADLACRARRRRRELLELGTDVPEDQLREEIAARDHRDRTRPTSPLVVPAGAVVVDTSELTIEQVVDRIVGAVRASGLAL
jgi:cytidylate kinase